MERSHLTGLKLILVLFCCFAAQAGFSQTRAVKLTSLRPVFYTQGGRQLTTTGDENGWKPEILDRKFEFGVNTFANSEIIYMLNGKYKTFTAWVGMDSKAKITDKEKVTYADQDENSNKESAVKGKVIFRVFGDGNKLFDSGIMDESSPAKEIKTDVEGIKELELVVYDAEAGGDPNHSKNNSKINWAEPTLSAHQAEKNIQENKTAYQVSSGNSVLNLSSQGEIVGFSNNGHLVAIQGTTKLAQCKETKPAEIRKIDGGGLQITRTIADKSGHRGSLTERFTPAKNAIRWEVDVYSNEKAWSAAVITSVKYPVANHPKFWTAWSNPDLVGQGGWTNSILKTQWMDPLEAKAFTNSARWFGGNPMMYVPTSGDIFSVPIATVIDAASRQGFSLVQSPEDTLLYFKLITTADGSVEFQRRYHRMGEGKHVRFAVDMVGHDNDWRGGLNWMVDRYPNYFEPENDKANAIGGCGAYSSWEGALDTAKLKQMAFTFNWKASFDFPYMGMFLPPVENWQSFATSAESAKDPWAKSPYKGAPTSRQQLENYSRLMKGYNFYVLNYFNVTEFGTNIRQNWTVDKNIQPTDLWKNCNDYLHAKLADGILYNENGSDDYYRTWGQAIVMDAGAESYRSFLLEQAKRHIDYLPSSSGICIDRMDWLRYFNTRADDGITWYNNNPARSLFMSWRSLLDTLGRLMHKNDKVVFANPMVSMRLDMMEHIDGFYSEHNEFGNGLNSSVLLGIKKPVTAWTWDEQSLEPDPDRHFQQYLYLGVFPTAPVPDNNHEIRPGNFVDKWYLKYGPLFKSILGRKWVLQSNVVEVADGGAKANLFEVPGGFALPVVLAKKGMQTADIMLDLDKMVHSGDVQLEAILPGTAGSIPLKGTKDQDGQLHVSVPLKDGCAVVKILTADR